MSAVSSARRDFVKLFHEIARHRHRRDVFQDFIELAALALRKTTVRPDEGEIIEARYMSVVKRNEPDDVRKMPQLLAHLMLGLKDGGEDFLGSVAGELEILNVRAGQFFTPWNLSEAMARMVLQGVRSMIGERGFVTLCEPACGAGGMVLAAAKVIREEGFDPGVHLFVEATDIDMMAFNMAYLQLTVCGIPARVRRGDSLSNRMEETALTPAFFPFYAVNSVAFDKWRSEAVVEPPEPEPAIALPPPAAAKPARAKKPEAAADMQQLSMW